MSLGPQVQSCNTARLLVVLGHSLVENVPARGVRSLFLAALLENERRPLRTDPVKLLLLGDRLANLSCGLRLTLSQGGADVNLRSQCLQMRPNEVNLRLRLHLESKVGSGDDLLLLLRCHAGRQSLRSEREWVLLDGCDEREARVLVAVGHRRRLEHLADQRCVVHRPLRRTVHLLGRIAVVAIALRSFPVVIRAFLAIAFILNREHRCLCWRDRVLLRAYFPVLNPPCFLLRHHIFLRWYFLYFSFRGPAAIVLPRVGREHCRLRLALVDERVDVVHAVGEGLTLLLVPGFGHAALTVAVGVHILLNVLHLRVQVAQIVRVASGLAFQVMAMTGPACGQHLVLVGRHAVETGHLLQGCLEGSGILGAKFTLERWTRQVAVKHLVDGFASDLGVAHLLACRVELIRGALPEAEQIRIVFPLVLQNDVNRVLPRVLQHRWLFGGRGREVRLIFKFHGFSPDKQ